MVQHKRARGRPVTFRGTLRKQLAAMIQQHGGRRAKVLAPVPISVNTLLRIAKEFGIVLPKGRRPIGPARTGEPHQDLTLDSRAA